MPPRTPPTDHLDGYTPGKLGASDPASDPIVQSEVRRESADRKNKAGRWLHLDGFANQLTGIGAWETDKVYGGRAQGPEFRVSFLTGAECEDRWRGSDLGGRIVEQVPNEMTREGWDTTVQPEDDEEFKLDARTRARADAIARDRAYVDGMPGPLWHKHEVRARLRRRRDEYFLLHFDATQAVAPAGQAGAPHETPEPEEQNVGQAVVEELEARDRDLGVLDAVREALCYERAYGGGAVLLGVDDGVSDLTQPLDESRVRAIRHLTAFRGGWDGELIAWRYYNDPRKPKFGQPEIYMLRNLGVPIAAPPAPGETSIRPQTIPTNPAGALICYVHESRLLVFPGTAVSRRARVQMRGWGDSVFTRVGEVLSQYSQTWSAVANLMTDWAQGVLKMEGLADLLAGPNGEGSPDGQNVVAARMMAINMGKSIARTFLLDSEEDFTREVAPLSGIADVLQQFALRLAAAADQPVSMLMGQVKGGLGDAGNTDLRFFYDKIAGQQEIRVMPQVRRLRRLQFLAKDSPTGGVEPKKWTTTARALWQPTAGEEIDQRNKQALTDEIYLRNGVVTPAEIAASRFGGAKYSTETVIDLDARRAVAALQAATPTPEGATEEPTDPNAPALQPGDPATPPPADDGSAVELTPSAVSGIITVNEARAAKGLGPWPDEAEGQLTVAEFVAKRASVIAVAANAEAGSVGKPPESDTPPPPVVHAAPGAPPPKNGEPSEEPGKGAPPPSAEHVASLQNAPEAGDDNK
jgi:phage-related protein (TIGR01555 family)